MAFDYLRINSKKVGLDRDMGSYDFNIQVMSPMSGKDSEDLGVAFYVALVSALVNKPTAGGLVVLGQMSIHGVLSRIEQLGDRLRVAMDPGVFFPALIAYFVRGRKGDWKGFSRWFFWLGLFLPTGILRSALQPLITHT